MLSTTSPTALYGVVLLLAAMTYWTLQRLMMVNQGPGSLLATAVARDLKAMCLSVFTSSLSFHHLSLYGSRGR